MYKELDGVPEVQGMLPIDELNGKYESHEQDLPSETTRTGRQCPLTQIKQVPVAELMRKKAKESTTVVQ